jgi:uncharacterized membrane protein YphA (DoxX/SURF4 family)
MNTLMKQDTRLFFLTCLRYLFGLWLLFVGLSKVVGGATGFVGYIEGEFAATWLPALLVTIAAWLILAAENLIGLWLLIGRSQRAAWLAAALLMFVLLFGKTVTRDFATVANNWQYLLLCLGAAAWTRPEE